MLNVGLTGGIACGKSTVAGRLVEKGAFLIDADRLAHDLQKPGKAAWREVVDHFGPEILRSDRTIDRRKLGAIVFADPEKRELLNRLVHPAVQEARLRKIAEIQKRRPDAIILSDVPLLIETGMIAQFDLVLLVYLPPEAQIERLMGRDGFSREEAAARLAAQMPIDAKLPFADLVIRNDGSLAEMQRTTDEAWEELQRRESRLRSTEA